MLMFTWLGGKQASATNPAVLEEVSRPLHSASLPRLQNTGRASHGIGGERTLTHWLFQTLAMIHTQPLSPVLSMVLKTQPYPWISTEHECKQGQRTLAGIGCREEDSTEVTMPRHGESGAQDLSGAEAEPESY